MSAPEFTIDIFQNEYLPDRAREVNAIVTVTSAGSAVADVPAAAARAAEIIIIDCSGSMGDAAWRRWTGRVRQPLLPSMPSGMESHSLS